MTGSAREIPEDLDHFGVFGLPHLLSIDEEALRKSFLRLSREYHPDRFAGASPEELRAGLRAAARVNDAHRVLSDAVARAEYLLGQKGVERPEGEAKCPPDLLMEVFEIRERLQEAPDPGIAGEVRALVAESDRSLAELFLRHDAASDEGSRHDVLTQLRRALDRRKFLVSLAREVERATGASAS